MLQKREMYEKKKTDDLLIAIRRDHCGFYRLGLFCQPS
jgi:hypothetical protein